MSSQPLSPQSCPTCATDATFSRMACMAEAGKFSSKMWRTMYATLNYFTRLLLVSSAVLLVTLYQDGDRAAAVHSALCGWLIVVLPI